MEKRWLPNFVITSLKRLELFNPSEIRRITFGSARVVAELPKTRSGKIMRRLLKDVAENRQVGDATTLADPNVMRLISDGLNSSKDED